MKRFEELSWEDQDAKALSFLSFNNQNLPLQGFGIGDSLLSEDGECANLDAKYSTYYNGLQFWDHAWLTQEDAQRLNIQVGSTLIAQHGICPVPLELNALSAIFLGEDTEVGSFAGSDNADRLRVKMWPGEGYTARLCIEEEDGTERCKEKTPNYHDPIRGGGLQLRLSEQSTGYRVETIDENGMTSIYGPYNIPEQNSWEDVFACESSVSLENTQARLRPHWGDHGRWILKFDLSDEVRIRSYGLNRQGKLRYKQSKKEAGQRRFSFGLQEEQESIDLVVRDSYGCTVEKTYAVPTHKQWSTAIEE